MLTPTDIQNTQFSRTVRGYKEEEVDEFLLKATNDISELMRENAVLKDNLKLLQEEVDRSREQENLIIDTLESAKGLMRDISTSAERRAEIVLKNAELDAERTLREANDSVEKITEDALEMARRWEQFKARYKNLLQTELDRFDNMSVDLDPDRTGFYSENPKFTSPGKTVDNDAPKVSGNDRETIKTAKNGD